MHTCIPSHGLQRSWRLCPRWVNAGNKNTPSVHHPRRWNGTTSMVGLKKMVTYTKISPKMGNPRDLAGEHRRRRRIRNGLIMSPSSYHWAEANRSKQSILTQQLGSGLALLQCVWNNRMPLPIVSSALFPLHENTHTFTYAGLTFLAHSQLSRQRDW